MPERMGHPPESVVPEHLISASTMPSHALTVKSQLQVFLNVFETLWKSTCSSKQAHARLSEMLRPSGGCQLEQQGLAALPRAFSKELFQMEARNPVISCHLLL